jgi:hypothetical protein
MNRFIKGISVALIILVGIEMLFRVMWTPPDYSRDLDVGMQLKAHFSRIWSLETGVETQFGVSISIDEQGLRRSSLSQDGETWLLLGDSSFFGHGLSDSETLHEHLQKQLHEQGHSIHVRCGGVPGYSILQTERLMNEVGWDLSPKMLLIGNLWSDNNFDHFVDKEWLEALQPYSGINALLWNSRLFLWLNHVIRPPKFTKKGDPHSRISWIKEPYQTGRRRVDVQTYMQTLDRLVYEAGERGVGVVLIQPANRYRVEGSVPNATWDPYFEAQRMVASHRGVPIFDAAAYLRVFGLSAQEAFLDELHPTEKANKLLAQGIILSLQAVGWPEYFSLPSRTDTPLSVEIPDPWSTGVSFGSNTGQDMPDGVQ